MHLPRKLLLLAIAAIAATAFAATPASATQQVQIVDEDTGLVCSNLTGTAPNGHTGGGCKVHFGGVVSLRVDLVFFEVDEATCNVELEMRIGPTGEVGIYDVEHNTGPEINCSTVTTECDLPWEGSGEEDGPVGRTQFQLSVCLDPSESDSNCIANIPFDIVEQSDPVEDLEIQIHVSFSLCEIEVDLEMEHDLDVNPPDGVDDHEYIHINHP